MQQVPQYQLDDISGPGVYGRLPGVPDAPSTQPEYPPTSSSNDSLQYLGLANTGARIASNAGAFGSYGSAVRGVSGDIGNIAGIYTGLERGGTGGDLSAAASAAQLGGRLGSSVLGEAAGPLAIASGVYNFAENWQSGATGQDTLQGAESGAEIGTAIEPGVGTLVGAVIGGAAGALSSAFGGGATDPETHNWQGFINATGGANATQAQVNQAAQGMSPQAAFNLLSGVMDIKDGRIPFVNAFGRMGETEVVNQMTSQIDSAIKAGKISPSATPDQIYSQIVEPWLNSKGATITPETGGLQLQAVLKSLIGSWQSGQLTSSTPLDSGGQMDTTLSQFAGGQPSGSGNASSPLGGPLTSGPPPESAQPVGAPVSPEVHPYVNWGPVFAG